MRYIIFLVLTILVFIPFRSHASMTEEAVSSSLIQLLKYNPNHKLRKDPKHLKRFTLAVLAAANTADVKAAAIIATSYAESTFKMNTKGKIGELGTMQLHGKAQWSYCRLKENRKINRKLLEDQLICGGHWLRMSIDICNGTYYEGFASYMTKKTCKPKRRTRLQWVVMRRLNLMWDIQNGTISLTKPKN